MESDVGLAQMVAELAVSEHQLALGDIATNAWLGTVAPGMGSDEIATMLARMSQI